MNKAAESTLGGSSYNQDAKAHQRNTRHQFQGRSLLLLEAVTGREKNPQPFAGWGKEHSLNIGN